MPTAPTETLEAHVDRLQDALCEVFNLLCDGKSGIDADVFCEIDAIIENAIPRR